MKTKSNSENTAPKQGDLRVWWVSNPPGPPEHHLVSNIEEAMGVIKMLTERDLKDKTVSANAGGLEIFEEDDWSEYYDDDGNDIDDCIEQRDAKFAERK